MPAPEGGRYSAIRIARAGAFTLATLLSLAAEGAACWDDPGRDSGSLSSVPAPFSAFFASLPTLTLGWPIVGSTQAAPDWTTLCASPVDGQVVSGVGTKRGWTFAEAGAVPPALGLMVMRDKASQQSKTIEVWLCWFESTQGLGVVAANN